MRNLSNNIKGEFDKTFKNQLFTCQNELGL